MKCCERQRESRLVAHVSRAAVWGKSKGSAPAKRTSAAQLVYLHTGRQAESAIAKQQAWDAQEQGKGETITYPRDLGDRENTPNRAEMEP
jgi:hypothetical protein